MSERPKFDSQTLKRLLSYMRAYKGTLVLVTICILLSAVASAASPMFLQKLIDGYIVPMLGTASPDFSGLIRALVTIGCVYLIGTLATWLYNRRMVTIAQGTLKRIRDEMFEKMQRLPIRYFDTHTLRRHHALARGHSRRNGHERRLYAHRTRRNTRRIRPTANRNPQSPLKFTADYKGLQTPHHKTTHLQQ